MSDLDRILEVSEFFFWGEGTRGQDRRLWDMRNLGGHMPLPLRGLSGSPGFKKCWQMVTQLK